jgi:hypothetical protein
MTDPLGFLHDEQELQDFGLELEALVDLDNLGRVELDVEQDIVSPFLLLDRIRQIAFAHIFFFDDIGAIGFEFIPDEIQTLRKVVVLVSENEHDFVSAHLSSLRTFPVR